MSPKKVAAINTELRPPKGTHIRHIKAEMWQHAGFAKMSLFARIAMPGCWTHCDKHGRFEWKPSQFKLNLFPWDNLTPEQMEAIMYEWVTQGFVRKYKADGEYFGEWVKWSKHQYIGNMEEKSKRGYPAPDSNQLESTQVDYSISQCKGEGVGIGLGESQRESQPTNPPANAAGGKVGAAPDSKPKPQAADRETLWTELQLTWEDNYHEFPPGNNCDDAPRRLIPTGLSDVEKVIRARDISRDDVLSFFDEWLETRYADGLATGNRINQPLTLFAQDLPFAWRKKYGEGEPSYADVVIDELEPTP